MIETSVISMVNQQELAKNFIHTLEQAHHCDNIPFLQARFDEAFKYLKYFDTDKYDIRFLKMMIIELKREAKSHKIEKINELVKQTLFLASYILDISYNLDKE